MNRMLSGCGNNNPILVDFLSASTHTTFILDDPTPTTSSPDPTISEMTSTPTTPSTPGDATTATPSTPGDATTATPSTPGDTTITATTYYSTYSAVPPTPSPVCIGKADGNYPVGKCSTKYTTCLNGIASYQVINYHNYKDLSFTFCKFPLINFRCV